MEELTPEMVALLRAPFRPDQVRQRSGAGGKLFDYVTARDVAERLDDAVGAHNWATAFAVIDPDKWAVECRLTVCDVLRADVGYPNSDKPDELEPLKAAYSDAFKRAAVMFGVGRHLYGHGSPDTARPGGGDGSNRPVQARTGTAPALAVTDPQLKAIYAIALSAQRMDGSEVEARCRDRYGNPPAGLTRRQASEFIDALRIAAP